MWSTARPSQKRLTLSVETALGRRVPESRRDGQTMSSRYHGEVQGGDLLEYHDSSFVWSLTIMT